jgi:transketolase
MRNAFAEEVFNLAKKDKDIVLLSGDIGNRLFDNFRKKFTNRFFNCGIAEANMTGVASGLAATGFKPITYTIAPFNTIRCLEQIKLDICYPNLPVVIVGTGSGLSYATLGSTHHSLEDISILKSLPNIEILCPSDPLEVKKLLKTAIKSKNPVYLRIGKKREKIFNNRKKFGKLDLIKKGQINCLLSIGPILENVFLASKKLDKSSISNSVYDLRHIRPFDEKKVKEIFKKYKKIFIIEEHYKNVGVFNSILHWSNSIGLDGRKLYSIGVDNKFIKFTGEQELARRKVGLDPESIYRFVKKIDDKSRI